MASVSLLSPLDTSHMCVPVLQESRFIANLTSVVPIFIIPQQRIENMTKTAMFLSMVGFVLVVIVCLVMGRGTYQPSRIMEYRSTSGWNPGVGFLLGIGNGEYAFAAAGACVHIAEEIPNPSRKVPLVM